MTEVTQHQMVTSMCMLACGFGTDVFTVNETRLQAPIDSFLCGGKRVFPLGRESTGPDTRLARSSA